MCEQSVQKKQFLVFRYPQGGIGAFLRSPDSPRMETPKKDERTRFRRCILYADRQAKMEILVNFL